MELILLTVPGCPRAAIFLERLAAALADYPGVVVRCREVTGESEAIQAGMHGSPTLLIDGADRLPGKKLGRACPAGCTGIRPGRST
jgi:hypothetical protein